MLEDEVDEKFYLSEKMTNYLFTITEKNKARRNGNVYKVSDPDGIAKTITTHEGTRVKDNFIEQVGQMYPNSGNPQAGRIYNPQGISTAMDTYQGGNRMPKVIVNEATKKGYAEAFEGDSVNLEHPNSKTRRGRVGKQVAQTLTTSCNQAVVVDK